MITQDTLRELVSYNPETGEFWHLIPGKGKQLNKPAGSKSVRDYLVIVLLGKRYYSHRLAWLYMTGNMPERVEHRNTITNDNRWTNLRLATQSENMANRNRESSNSSGYKGVCWSKAAAKWVAQIGVNRKVIYLGSFDCPKEAHQAYRQAAEKYFGEYKNFG